MSHLAITIKLPTTIDIAVEQVTNSLKEIGFGILTRIDFDQKIKEKINETLPRTVILGACNPRLAFEVYNQNSDTALFIPCNIVVKEIGENSCKIEAMRPSKLIQILDGISNTASLLKAESDLERILANLQSNY